MNTMKKNGGFTLVELIIVIAILAILSTGAIAGYSAYITKANETSVNTWKNQIETAATLANAETGAVSVRFELVSTGANAGKVAVIVSGDLDEDFPTLFAGSIEGETGAGILTANDTVTTAKKDEYVCYMTAPKGWPSAN